MARPVSISDDQILEAARAVFTEKGPRATTAEIAERAEVAEGTLFKRFGNKAGLHKAAMTSDIAGGWIRREMRAQAPLRTKQDFERFIRWQTDVVRNVAPVSIMAWSFRAQVGALPADLAGKESAPLVAIRTLAEMLEAEMAAGYLAARDAPGIAQIITGSVWYFVFLELVLGKVVGAMDEDRFVHELVRLVFADLQPARKPRAPGKQPRAPGKQPRAPGKQPRAPGKARKSR
jgi:AcrR family transcriptional regulator